MKLHMTFAISTCAILGAAALTACGGDDTNGGSAGAPGTGGTTVTGSGGTGNTGGTTGTGGTGTGTGGGGTTGTGGGTISDASVEAGCTCTGAACTPAGVLFNFDSGDAGDAASWDFFPAAAADAAGPVKGTSTTEGHTTAGSLTLTVPFTDFGQPAVSIQHNFGSSPTTGALDWSCKTAVHFWVKVGAPGGTADAGTVTAFLNGIQAYIQSGDPLSDAANMGGYSHYTAVFVNASTFADGAFHEIVVPLLTGTSPVNPVDINQVGVQVLPLATAPDGGGVVPGPVELFIDDISLQ